MSRPWPLFGLRLRSAQLEFRLPTDEDLFLLGRLARAGIHPPEDMPFGFPWTDAPGAQLERDFLQYHWVSLGSGEMPVRLHQLAALLR